MIIKHAAAYVAVLVMTASLAACGESSPVSTSSQAQATGAAFATPVGEAPAATDTASSPTNADNRRNLDANIDFVMVKSELAPYFSQEALDNLAADGTDMTYLLSDGEMEAFGRARTPEEAVAALEPAKKYLSTEYYDALVKAQSSDDQTLINFSDTIIPSVGKNNSAIQVNADIYNTTGIERPIRVVPTDEFAYAFLQTGDGGINYIQYQRSVTFTATTNTATITWDAHLKYDVLPNDDNHWVIYNCETLTFNVNVVPN